MGISLQLTTSVGEQIIGVAAPSVALVLDLVGNLGGPDAYAYARVRLTGMDVESGLINNWALFPLVLGEECSVSVINSDVASSVTAVASEAAFQASKIVSNSQIGLNVRINSEAPVYAFQPSGTNMSLFVDLLALSEAHGFMSSFGMVGQAGKDEKADNVLLPDRSLALNDTVTMSVAVL